MIQIIQMLRFKTLPTLIQLHSEMDGAPPYQKRASAANFLELQGCCSCQELTASQGISKTMVKRSLKISAAAVAMKRLFPLISSTISYMHYQSLG